MGHTGEPSPLGLMTMFFALEAVQILNSGLDSSS